MRCCTCVYLCCCIDAVVDLLLYIWCCVCAVVAVLLYTWCCIYVVVYRMQSIRLCKGVVVYVVLYKCSVYVVLCMVCCMRDDV